MTTTRRTRADVVAAAGRLFAEQGFHGTSMRDLGREIGLLGSSLYSHVEGKEQLLLEVIRNGGALFLASAEAVDSDLPPMDRLRALIDGHVSIVIDHQDEARTFLNEERFLPSERRAEVVELRNMYEQAFVATIEAGRRSGDFSADPRTGAIFALSILNAIERWYRPGGRLSAADLSEEIFEFVSGGLA